jgi:hypothetical protein
MDLKLTLLFFLIGAIINLRISAANLIELQSEFDGIGATLRAVLFATQQRDFFMHHSMPALRSLL